MKQPKLNILLASLLILAAGLSRVVLFPNNPSPLIGIALFSGAIISDKKLAFLLPVLSLFLSDLIFEVSGIAQGFWGWGQVVQYGILFLLTALAFTLKNWNAVKVAGYSIGSSLLFFALSNLSFFLIDNPVYHLYTQDINGLKNCYIAALPFLKKSLAADLVYSAVLFGSYYLLQVTALKKRSQAA
jgi:hypothetical protein